MLRIRNSVPDGLVQAHPAEVKSLLGGPTLIHLNGARQRPLFVSVLLHGNETTGLSVIQRLLQRYESTTLPRALSIFIGNVEAARVGKRLLPGQRDYNRIWVNASGVEYEMTQRVLQELRNRHVFASVDIHNNTGKNPYYAIIADRRADHLKCASLFSDTIVFAACPDTTCTVAFSKLCPAVTVEAGLPGDPEGIRRTVEYLDQCLGTDDLTAEDIDGVNLFQTVAVVKVRECCSFGFLGEDVDVQLINDIDRLNFRELEPGTRLARVRYGEQPCLDVRHIDGREVYREYFAVDDGILRFVRSVMPAMLTTNRDIISLDCLCYLMERLNHSEFQIQEYGNR